MCKRNRAFFFTIWVRNRPAATKKAVRIVSRNRALQAALRARPADGSIHGRRDTQKSRAIAVRALKEAMRFSRMRSQRRRNDASSIGLRVRCACSAAVVLSSLFNAAQIAAQQLPDLSVVAPSSESELWRELEPPPLPPAEELFGPPPSVGAEQLRAAPPCSLWYISTRAVGPQPELGRLTYLRFLPGAGWQPATLAEFLAEDALRMPTVVFVHGNRYAASNAFETGETIFASLSQAATHSQPVRFVIWSWPSDRLARRGQLVDLRVKATRAECQGFTLARLVAQIHPEVCVSLVGHSFGARLISSSLHFLGGGELGGLQLDAPATKRRSLRGVLLAAAMGNYWLTPGDRHGRGLEAVDELFVVSNSRDSVLRWYPHLFPGGRGPDALGYTGMRFTQPPGEALAKIIEWDVAPLIGKAHNLADYFQTPKIWSSVAHFALFEGTGWLATRKTAAAAY